MVSRKMFGVAVTVTACIVAPLATMRPSAQAQAVVVHHPPVRMNKANARVSAVHAVPGETDAEQLLAQGKSLSAQAAAGLEQKVAADPMDLNAHLELLGYYHQWQFSDPVNIIKRDAYTAQVVWLIQNHPESVVFEDADMIIMKRYDPHGFDQEEKDWMKQVSLHPQDAAILGNAAEFCEFSKAPTSARLFEQALAIEPSHADWHNQLGMIDMLLHTGRGSKQVQQAWAQKALSEYQTAQALNTAKGNPTIVTSSMTLAAYDAGKYTTASLYANQLLQESQRKRDWSKKGNKHLVYWDRAGKKHHAYMVLGLLALKDGNTALAEQDLEAMGAISGSPSLDSFGPNMRLAYDLLKQGDTKPVLAYFQECAKFWTYNNGQQLKMWTAQVQQGQIPNFSANMVY